jgi:uncharacterized protein YdaU (DUF1376 family)
MPYARFYAADWLHGTRDLSDENYTAYHRIVSTMYDLGGPLPYNLETLRNVINKRTVGKTRRILENLVSMGKLSISPEDNMLHNARADHELARFQAKCERADQFMHGETHGSTTKTEAKSAANSTRAHSHTPAQSQNPESRNIHTGRGNGSVAAPDDFRSGLQRRLDEFKRQQEIGHATQSHEARDLGNPTAPGESDSQAQGHD